MKYIVFFLGLGIVLLLFFSANGNNSNEESDSLEDQGFENRKMDAKPIGIDFAGHEFFQPLTEPVTHLHGLGYPNNQDALFIATHHGIKVFSNGKWYETLDNQHDFMGFQATATGFYSSGHPAEGSDLENPLGLMKSEDFGRTLEKINFYGESDFHHLSASYFTQSVYIVNTTPNSQIGTGLFYSSDGGNVWEQSQLDGLPPLSTHSIATHPKLSKIVGISTPEGLYLSHNKGNSFSLISMELPVGALYIKDESILYIMVDGDEQALLEQSLESDDATEIKLPRIEGDSILYIAVNPLNEEEISFSTADGNVWMTKDYGETWSNILNEGRLP
ncbi:F510_1955 family glycosylhydrolase [Bacillus sp. AK128]